SLHDALPIYRGVAEQDLNGAQIDARFQQMRGEAVPEQMHAAALADAGLHLGLGENGTRGLIIHRPARVAPRKEPRPRPIYTPVGTQLAHHTWRQRCEAILVAL